jgi:hypothetical protein
MVEKKRKTSIFAILSLIFGIATFILPFFITMMVLSAVLAVVFGIIALIEIKRTNKKGKGMAIAGMVIGILILLFVGLFATDSWYL